jgi:hypothetical protein
MVKRRLSVLVQDVDAPEHIGFIRCWQDAAPKHDTNCEQIAGCFQHDVSLSVDENFLCFIVNEKPISFGVNKPMP